MVRLSPRERGAHTHHIGSKNTKDGVSRYSILLFFCSVQHGGGGGGRRKTVFWRKVTMPLEIERGIGGQNWITHKYVHMGCEIGGD